MEIKNVLSLFDGMSCGQLALEKANIKYDNYYASEVDKYAMQIAMKNYPKTIQLGDVTKLNTSSLPTIDLLIGGSPCQSFSNAGTKDGFEGKSKLFFEFVRILKETKPKYFLLENVKMKKEWVDIITETMGVEPIEISSALVVPQNRKRLYWTNIPNITQLKQVEYNVYDYIETDDGFPSACGVKRVFNRKEIFSTLTATYYKGIRGSGRPAVSLKEGFLDDTREYHRMLTPTECEGIQDVPRNYTEGVSKTQRYKMLGNGWTIGVIAHILKHIKIENNETY